VQYPKPVTYLILVFDLLMMLMLAFFIVLLLLVLVTALPVSILALVPACVSVILINNYLVDLRSLNQKSLELDEKKIRITSFGSVLERPVSDVKRITLIRLRIPITETYYAHVFLGGKSRVAELSKSDYQNLARFLGKAGFERIPGLSLPLYSTEIHKIPST
jgi:hypothetical protein